jgi:REP element-mobilizing transposase RayT
MLTWTTYGTWLQGDKRKYVKDGKVFAANDKLLRANVQSLKGEPVRLNNKQKAIVKLCILDEAKRNGQEIKAIAVYSNHVHIVCGNTDEDAAAVVRRYKAMTTMGLRRAGFQGKMWTRGYDKRFCFDEKELQARIKYVNGHK